MKNIISLNNVFSKIHTIKWLKYVERGYCGYTKRQQLYGFISDFRFFVFYVEFLSERPIDSRKNLCEKKVSATLAHVADGNTNLNSTPKIKLKAFMLCFVQM